MQRQINRALNPPQLDVELRAAVPALFGMAGDLPIAHYTLSELGPDQWLMEVPDNADIPAITAVVTAHDPTIQTPQQDSEQADKTHVQSLRDEYQTLKNGLDSIRAHQVAVRGAMDDVQALADPTTVNLATIKAMANATKQVSQSVEEVSKDLTTMCHGLDLLLDGLTVLYRQRG